MPSETALARIMTDSNILFDSFAVSSNTGIGASGSLFGGGSSITTDISANSNIISNNSSSNSNNNNNTNSSSSSSTSVSGTTSSSSGSLSFNSGITNNGSNGSSNSIKKALPTPNSPTNSNNNNKSSPTNHNCNTNGTSGSSSHSSPNSLDLGNRLPSNDIWRANPSSGITLHGLDLSKPPSLSSSSSSSLIENENIKLETPCGENNEEEEEEASAGLDLSKPEAHSPDETGKASYRRPSDLDPSPFMNGMHSDPPTPQGNHAPSRSLSSGSGAGNGDGEEAEARGSPFGIESVLNGRATESLTNGESALALSLSKPVNSDRPNYMKTSPKFPDPFSGKAFDEGSPPPPLKFKDPYLVTKAPPLFDLQLPPSSDAHTKPASSKYKDSCIAARLADNTFLKPLDSYSKLLEGYGHNARNNNNNNNSTSNNNTNNSAGLDSPYVKIAESYAKQIENFANGYKSDSASLNNKDGLLFKPEAPPPPPTPHSASSIGNFPKLEASLTNGIGGSSYGGSKSDAVTSSSSHSPGSNSLPSILNFSTNHLRGLASAESGLASYLSGYGVTGPLSGGGGGGSGGDARTPGGGANPPGGVSEGGLSRASPNNKLACRFCGKTFSQAGYIKAHERLHTGEKPFACSVCGKRFSDPSNWKKHERVHANNKKTGPGGHVGGLDQSENKVRHLFLKSVPSFLTSSFHHRLAMRHHYHHDLGLGGPITCKICGKMFSSQSSLSTHKRIHTGERPYRCRSCGKSFTQIGTLRTHERIHTGEKPYICKICGRTFAQSGSFRMHENRHLRESIQRCHICYATFTSLQELQRHMTSHPQVAQAILEFEEGNQSLMDRLSSDMASQLGDAGLAQLGHPDPDGPPGHNLLQGDQRSLGVPPPHPPHPRCPPPPLLPESFLLDSEAAAFHVQSRGLYPSPGQLPPFSSILPFRPHPGAPPAFPPTFPPAAALGLLGSQSLPVTSHADLLTKHPIFGAMLGGPQHPHHPPPPPPPPPHHHHHPSHHHHHHQHHLSHPQHDPHHHQHQQQQHGLHPHRHSPHHAHLDMPALSAGRGVTSDGGTDVVSTTSSGSRRGASGGSGGERAELSGAGTPPSALRTSSRSYTPEEARSDSEPIPGEKADKDRSSGFDRSLSSGDEGPVSPEEDEHGGHHRARVDGNHPLRYHKNRKINGGALDRSDDEETAMGSILLGGGNNRIRRGSDNEDDDIPPEDDDDTDIDERYEGENSGYARKRRYSDEVERSNGDGERGRERERAEKASRNRSRSYERERDRARRDRKRSHSGSFKSNNNNSNIALDYIDEEEEAMRDGEDSPHSHRRSPIHHNQGSSSSGNSATSDTNNHRGSGGGAEDEDLLAPNSGAAASASSKGSGSSGSDPALLRPPKRHIERQNLNTRMIPSSSSRKQRHPMRRFSSAGSEHESPQSCTPSTTMHSCSTGQHSTTSSSSSHLPVSSTTVEAGLERGDLDDSELVTFLLTKGRVYKCVHCHMIFEDASLFLLHNGFHAHDEPFRCVVCHHVCKDRIDFNCHLTSHIKRLDLG